VFVSGQGSISPDGGLVGEGDIEAQATRVFENLRTVLERSGCGLDAVVKLTIYLTDITTLRDVMRIKEGFLPGPHPAATAIGVAGLALPGMMIEVEAVAAL